MHSRFVGRQWIDVRQPNGPGILMVVTVLLCLSSVTRHSLTHTHAARYSLYIVIVST